MGGGCVVGEGYRKILSYWTDDALLIFPGQPILEGKAAIRPFYFEHSWFKNPLGVI